MKAFSKNIKKLSATLGLAVMVLALTGCPEPDDSSGAVGVSPNGRHACQGGHACPVVNPAGGVDYFLGSGYGYSNTGYSQMTLGLDIYGDPSGSTAGGFYTGPIFMLGTLFVSQNAGGGCPIPSGRYDVQTDAVGSQDYSGIMRNVDLSAVGFEGNAAGHTLQLRVVDGGVNTVQPAIVDEWGKQYQLGMWATLVIEAVDNYQCQYGFNSYFFGY